MLYQVVYYTKVVKVNQNTKFFKNIHFPMKFIFLLKIVLKKCKILHIISAFFRKIVVNSLQKLNFKLLLKWERALRADAPKNLQRWNHEGH